MTVSYIPFPPELRGIVFGMVYGHGSIVIDSSQDEATQDRALRHELAHLVLRHMDSEKNIREIEQEADALASQLSVEQLKARLLE